jgi:protein involved in polysaccharide export with SLBB domain
MKPGDGWSSWTARRPGRSWWLLLGLLAGCATVRPHVDRTLMADKDTERNAGVAERYAVGCPDVLQVTIADRPELSKRYTVGADGRIDLGPLGRLRVEGLTTPEIAQQIAELARQPGGVQVRVAAFESQELYLFGPGVSLQRSVAYQGQETVLDLLQRVGGITPGAAPEDVYVVRSRIAEGERPEVFHVDLRAIVLQHDYQTNLRLQPFDQVHVGETRRSRLEKCVPPCLLPLYQALCGTRPDPLGGSPEGGAPKEE